MRRAFFLLAVSMVTTQVAYSQKLPSFDVQGHRGARGIKPENTIPAFIAALELGVTTLEMDLAVTSDNKVVVSHEPWMSAAYCLGPSGKVIDEKEEMKAIKEQIF
jgi:glycerophosphoryl diester phosphodiesterase